MIVLFDNTVIGDTTPELKAIYEKVAKATGLDFHPQFRYSESTTEEEAAARPILAKMGYELKYFSGCFNPYLCKITRR
ncbi:hypothetical protein UFOVP1138_60 [uncultured Caudovirales phage]|uniref:Uncharacterized protein n=1 Tax=uncultured Caudovirales phage TaxID=2100421 RepID=A0A6J5QNS5_9CAUD|nr:hypothetical protein UFOVP975_60 [uncultured Caudovirales phage]CAB4186289.1 hypothetical protein UFOVP1138_60 [uncultured Caudovirales phage]CAB4204437.1 hypothetical protein UFOVP1394_57 [uncultured Caudovirales phage]